MFGHIRAAIAEQRIAERLRVQHGHRVTAQEPRDKDNATEAPRFRVLNRSDGKVTLLWEIAPGWYRHASGDRGEVKIHEDVALATLNTAQNMNVMGGDVKKDLHPEWTDSDWEQARIDGNHEEFDKLADAGFDITQESDWRN